MRRVGLVVHGGKAAAVDGAHRLRRWAAAHDVDVVELDVWHDLPEPPEPASTDGVDAVVTIGGDGTFLRGARVAAGLDVPVLGVDVGRVGFLTTVPLGDLERALDVVHDGSAETESRLTLTMRSSRPLQIPEGLGALLRYGRGPEPAPPPVHPSLPSEVGWGVPLDVVAVNDVVFEKLSRDRQASLGLYVGGRLFASYSADAMIVASSTGSTAYSFAAGGPILFPRLRALVVTPVAAHMVFDRSLVVPPDEAVAVRVLDRSGQVVVTVDGQLAGVLDPGDWVGVYAGPHPCRLVRLGPADFPGRLRERFGLVDAAAAKADGTPPLTYRPDLPVPDDLRHLHLPPVG